MGSLGLTFVSSKLRVAKVQSELAEGVFRLIYRFC